MKTKRTAADHAEVVSTARADVAVAATWIHVSELRPNPKNPRVHGQEVLLLARTIVRTTWGAPILVQRSTMRIIGGHGRLEAAKEILAGIEVDGFLRGGAGYQFRRDAPPECLPVCVLDVSDAEADAMTLADNAKRLQGRDDPAALVAMATALFERNAPTMIDMGLGADDLDALVKQAGDAVLATAGAAQSAPTDGTPAGDAATEWEGMPEYASEDKTSHRSIVVHFASDDDVAAFGKLIGTTAFGNNSTWFPPRSKDDPARDVGHFANRAYVSADDS